MSAVADLLTQSRQAHLEYRRHAGACDKHGNITQTYTEAPCVLAVQKALNLRREAHRLDPEHRDVAWQSDPADHQDLLDFYEKFLRD